MRKIAVVTGTRAEYGLIKNILKKIEESNCLQLKLIVTGTHLSEKYGNTINEIIEDGFNIDEKIPIILESYSEDRVAIEMGTLMIKLSSIFNKMKPDILLILGDRYEIFAAASTAITMNIPIAHISGGEITEGVIDEQIRHAITKMSHIHFPGAELYRNNIIKMGEESWRVFNFGDPGIDNIKKMNVLTQEELTNILDVEVDKSTVLVTYHPVTLEKELLKYQIENLIDALDKLNRKTIITYPNADNGGEYIIEKLEEFSRRNPKVRLFKNLGSLKYLSIMKLCGVIVGNSSSGIVEAPYLKVPTVNIGNRQKGRLMAESIINCSNKSEDIVNAVNNALSNEYQLKAKNTTSLYGVGNTSEKIVEILESIEINEKLLKKKFV